MKLEDKSKYEQMAADDKERYKTEFDSYRKSDDFDISSLCIKELKQMCRDKKLKVSGKKADIVSRLKQSKSKSDSGDKSESKSGGKSKSKSKSESKSGGKSKSKSKSESKRGGKSKSKSKSESKSGGKSESESKSESKSKSKDTPTTVKEQIDSILES